MRGGEGRGGKGREGEGETWGSGEGEIGCEKIQERQ